MVTLGTVVTLVTFVTLVTQKGATMSNALQPLSPRALKLETACMALAEAKTIEDAKQIQ